MTPAQSSSFSLSESQRLDQPISHRDQCAAIWLDIEDLAYRIVRRTEDCDDLELLREVLGKLIDLWESVR